MSLEQALSENTKAYLENTAAINALTAILQGQIPTGFSLGAQTYQTAEKTEVKGDKPPKKQKVDSAPKTEVKTEVKEETSPPVIPTLEETNKTLMDLAKKDRNSAVAVLTQFKAKSAREIPEDQRAEFLQAVKDKLQQVEE